MIFHNFSKIRNKKMSKPNRIETSDSLWDVDFELADQRIGARRNRIRQRLDAVKKVQKLIQVKHIFGYTGMTVGEQFPVQVHIWGKINNFSI